MRGRGYVAMDFFLNNLYLNFYKKIDKFFFFKLYKIFYLKRRFQKSKSNTAKSIQLLFHNCCGNTSNKRLYFCDQKTIYIQHSFHIFTFSTKIPLNIIERGVLAKHEANITCPLINYWTCSILEHSFEENSLNKAVKG